MLKKLENFLKNKYKPKEAPWKRKALFFLSFSFIIGVLISAYTQYNYHWTNDGVWIFIVPCAFISSIGLYISIFSTDLWVALILAEI